MDSLTIIRKHDGYVFPCVTNFYSTRLPVRKGEGIYIYGRENNKYLDFFGGILTVSYAHCQPEIAKRDRRSGPYPSVHLNLISDLPHSDAGGETIRDYSRKTKEVFLYRFRTEENKMAMLTAQLNTGTREFVTLRNSYHRRSFLAMTITGNAAWKVGAIISRVSHMHQVFLPKVPIPPNGF
jgi:4-aminobutyrate aminotransferase